MAVNQEGGLLGIVDSLLGPSFTCPTCKNTEAIVEAKCRCGWSYTACLPCMLETADRCGPKEAIDALQKHREECAELAKDVRISAIHSEGT